MGISVHLNGPIPQYANVAALPATASNGALAITLDSPASLYEYDLATTTWNQIGSGGGGGTGTVTSVSVASANGLAGTVANPTTTPAITLRTSVTGILSGNGTAISAASTTGSGAVVLAASPTLTGTLSAAAISASGNVTGSNLSGTNTGDQTITLTGDVTGSGTGSFAATIANGVVTNAKLANMAQATIKGRAAAAGTGDPTDLTPAQAITAMGLDNSLIASIGITIDGGGSVITTGVKGDIFVPYACTINSVTMLADQSGSIVVDIWKQTYASYPPLIAQSIVASAPPTISAANKSQDTTLTGWTTSIAAGSTLRFNVNSASTITRLNLVLKVTKI